MTTQRPINLNLLTIRFPITAIASILHRLSGFFLFLVIPLGLGLLSCSLKSPEGFVKVHHYLAYPLSKLVMLAGLLALFYHLLAGIRHMLMDSGLSESLVQARWSARFVMLLSLLSTLVLGVYLW